MEAPSVIPSPSTVNTPLPRVVEPKEKQWTKGAEPFKQNRYNLRKFLPKATNFKDRAAKHILAQHIFPNILHPMSSMKMGRKKQSTHYSLDVIHIFGLRV